MYDPDYEPEAAAELTPEETHELKMKEIAAEGAKLERLMADAAAAGVPKDELRELFGIGEEFDPEELAAAVELAMDIVGAELVFQKLHDVVSQEEIAKTRGFGNEAFVNYYKMFHHLDLDLDKSLTVAEFVKDVREGLRLEEATITNDDLERLF